jgi:hypothetical protein
MINNVLTDLPKIAKKNTPESDYYGDLRLRQYMLHSRSYIQIGHVKNNCAMRRHEKRSLNGTTPVRLTQSHTNYKVHHENNTDHHEHTQMITITQSTMHEVEYQIEDHQMTNDTYYSHPLSVTQRTRSYKECIIHNLSEDESVHMYRSFTIRVILT